MKILLTNDDGYNAIGIQILKEKLSKYGQVTIVAPFTHMSGKSISITIGEWMKVDKISEDVYAVHGTPSDCVSWALFALKEDFDLVVSGCNNGHNLSYDTLFSGTVGACLSALMGRKKCVAFSAPFEDFSVLEDNFDEIWEYINKYDLLSNEYLLNINLPREQSKGIKFGKLYYRNDYYYFEKKDNTYYALRDVEKIDNMPKDADCRLVKEGYVTFTPISRVPFSEEEYQKVLNKTKDK